MLDNIIRICYILNEDVIYIRPSKSRGGHSVSYGLIEEVQNG